MTALFVDPAGEEPLTRLYEEVTGERRPFAEVAAEAKLEQAQTTFADEAAQLAARLPFEADVGAGARVVSRLPHVRRSRRRVGGGRGPGGGRARRPARAAGADPPARGARPRRVRAPLPADDAAGAREGRRGHGVLPLAPARRAERGRRRSRRGSRSRWPTSIGRTSPRPPLGLLATTTHDTKRSGDVRARLACIAADPDGVGRARRAAARRLARPERGVPHPADGRRRVAAGRGPARALPREGASRGEGEHELARAGSRVGVGREALGGRAARRRGGRPRTRGGWRRAATRLRSG